MGRSLVLSDHGTVTSLVMKKSHLRVGNWPHLSKKESLQLELPMLDFEYHKSIKLSLKGNKCMKLLLM
jgi:hypothetical protein